MHNIPIQNYTDSINVNLPEVSIVCLDHNNNNNNIITVEMLISDTKIARDINILFLGDININYLVDNCMYIMIPLKILSLKYFSKSEINITKQYLYNVANEVFSILDNLYHCGEISILDKKIIKDSIKSIIEM